MATDKELEQYAHDCIRLAGMTDDPAIREPLFRNCRPAEQHPPPETPPRTGKPKNQVRF